MEEGKVKKGRGGKERERRKGNLPYLSRGDRWPYSFEVMG